ncbi:MAG: LysR family transcriptional regulator [bacterium]|nr:LysR family transcriptional regulator [bacterium]
MILDKRMQVFLAVANAGSFSKAARQLGLSQPALSFHVKSLESDLGEELFNRQGRKISLTPVGLELFRSGNKLAAQVQSIEIELTRFSKHIHSKIGLGGDSLTCAYTLPWTVAAYRKAHPATVFSYRHFNRELLIEGIAEGTLDIGFAGSKVEHRKIDVQPCFNDEVILVAASNSPAKVITCEGLRELPIIWLTSDQGLEMAVQQALKLHGILPNQLPIAIEVEELPLAKSFVEAGFGAAFMSRIAVLSELRNHQLREVKIHRLEITRTTYRLTRKEKQPRENINEFITYLQQQLWVEKLALPSS